MTAIWICPACGQFAALSNTAKITLHDSIEHSESDPIGDIC